MRHWQEIDNGVFLGGLPKSHDIARLIKLDIKNVVNMCDEYDGPISEYQSAGIEQLRLPIPDGSVPDKTTASTAIQFIKNAILHKQNVLIHCKQGRGRSAIIALCWLTWRGATIEDAFANLRKCRDRVHPDLLNIRGVRNLVTELCQSQK